MRADAARNLDAVLQTGARLFADDPATSIATIAAEAGVDRRTVYRRFATREALLTAVYEVKLTAAERVVEEARLEEAPVAVALHRYVEGVVPVSRRWPIDITRVEADEKTRARRQRLGERVDRFVVRLADEGLIRSDAPPGWAREVIRRLIDVAAHQQRELSPPQAADLVVATFLHGCGPASPSTPVI